MAQTRRRYTAVGDQKDWIVTVSWDERALDKAHWFEAQVEAVSEQGGEKFKFPPEIRTFRLGEIEHTFREYVTLDWEGDREAAINHHLNTIYRRVQSYIERGH